MFPDAGWVPPPTGDRLFCDDYHGQKTIVFDDFSGWMKQSYALRVCDKWPFALENKGGSVAAEYENVVFTSNFHPAEWWQGGLRDAMKSRIFGLDDREGEVFFLDSRDADLVAVGPNDPFVSRREFAAPRRVF